MYQAKTHCTTNHTEPVDCQSSPNCIDQNTQICADWRDQTPKCNAQNTNKEQTSTKKLEDNIPNTNQESGVVDPINQTELAVQG